MNVEILGYADKAGILLPVLILMIVIVYMPKIIQLIDSWKMRKINYLSTLHGNEFLIEDIQKMLKDEINNAAFQSIHGFRVGTLLREQLTNLHNQDRDRFTWQRIRIANPYIEVEKNKIVIKIHWYDKFFILLSIIGLLVTAILYTLPWVNFGLKYNLNTLGIAIVVSIGSAIMFFMFAYKLAQYRLAKLLKKAINELNVQAQK